MNVAMLSRLAELERKVATMMIPATVEQRDHAKGVRFLINDVDGKKTLSAWVKPPDRNKGTRSSWLPQVGSQHLIFTPPGSDKAASFVPMGHHDASPDPAADADTTVLFDDGTCRISIANGKITLKSGASSIVIEGGKITATSDLVQIDGSELNHNEKSISDTHKHTDVEPGGGLSGVPV